MELYANANDPMTERKHLCCRIKHDEKIHFCQQQTERCMDTEI